MTLIADVFPQLQTPKMCLDNSLKKPFSVEPSRSNMVNGPKHC